ncbi:MAG: hypothetical protein N2257_10585 [Thermodesulfovibrionales bacterium]|nr:hypothetical protein [Thermodesulfovibrionales bacterium]
MKFLLLVILFIIPACSKEEILSRLSEDIKAENERVLERAEAVKELFCFKCHSYEKFRGLTGKFPHEKHRDFYHCNQCHELKMHNSIKTDTTLCKNCHSLGRFTYTAAGIKTFFDHASHSKRNSCRDCHPDVFIMKRGMNRFTMEQINRGQSCGICHNGKKAFGAENCSLCHDMGG